MAAKKPPRQLSQTEDELAPVVDEAVLGAQEMHAVDNAAPVEVENLPTPQSTQSLEVVDPAVVT